MISTNSNVIVVNKLERVIWNSFNTWGRGWSDFTFLFPSYWPNVLHRPSFLPITSGRRGWTLLFDPTYLITQFAANLFRHASSYAHGGNTTWLSASDLHFLCCVAIFVEILWDLCCFSWACLSFNYQNLAFGKTSCDAISIEINPFCILNYIILLKICLLFHCSKTKNFHLTKSY